jgi:hypothetical protein
MNPMNIRVIYRKDLEGYWSWKVMVFEDDYTAFANCQIENTLADHKRFKTKKAAMENCEKTLVMLGLDKAKRIL